MTFTRAPRERRVVERIDGKRSSSAGRVIRDAVEAAAAPPTDRMTGTGA